MLYCSAAVFGSVGGGGGGGGGQCLAQRTDNKHIFEQTLILCVGVLMLVVKGNV